uniref:RRM domain-containing protein n=1 Tax=Chlamydomonas euryale TaxID=1486919 RepID=A0A7R9VIA3_9CHLO|mmetsp:Transcript_36420/g.107512  ORF Transcript_36420/g.107512 Transcript_36420/m.107512 type:complete len:361 (+) Transcript_36420:103-1185(+)
MSNALLDKSLDALIEERTKSSKGVRVKPTSAFAKKKVTAQVGRSAENGGSAPGGASTRGAPSRDAPGRGARSGGMGVTGGRIVKKGGNRVAGRTVTAMEDEHGALVPVMMVPASRLTGRMAGRMGRPIPASMGDDGLPPPSQHIRKDPDADGKWTHDLFDAREQGGAPRRRVAPPSQLRVETGTRVRVANIHRDVTRTDLQELFQECGTLISCDFDQKGSGNHNGSATVVFKFPEDAREAVKVYNNVMLDGVPLSVTVGGTSAVTHLSSGIRVTRNSTDADPITARGPSRMLASALPRSVRSEIPTRGMGSDGLPRGMGDGMPRGMGDGPSRPARGRGPGARGRIRSSVATSYGHDDMLE